MNVSGQISADDLVLGVDGGGTKTTAWLARRSDGRDASPLGVGHAGPGNPRAAGFETAQHSIAAAVTNAFAQAGTPFAPVASACLGLSGAGRTEEQQRILDWALTAGLARNVRVTHDAETILAAVADEPVGVALICGTGSLAWGRNVTGETSRCGGWGYLLGDEGGAYAIAIEGLRAAVRSADGRGPKTTLLPAFLERLQIASPAEIIGRIYHPDISRDRIADLAPVVFECSTSDRTASAIVAEACRELALMVTTLVSELRLEGGRYVLALAGGVFLRQPHFRVRFNVDLAKSAAAPQPQFLMVVSEPVRGAVQLARSL